MMSKKNVTGLLVAIVIVGAIVRFINLGTVPFRADEFLDINATVGYAQTGQWQAWDHNMGTVSTRINPASDARAWVYRWQVAKVFERFAPTEAVARSVSVLWGIAMIIFVYYAAVVWTRRPEIGLIAAALWSVNISGIEMSRTLRMYAMFAPVFLMMTVFVYRAMEQRAQKWRIAKSIQQWTGVHIGWAIIAAVTFGVALHLHALTANIAFGILAYLIAMTIISRGKDARYLVWLGIMAGSIGTLYFFAPQMIAQFIAGITFFEDHYTYIGHIFVTNFTHPLLGVLLMSWGAIALWRSGRRSEAVWISALTVTIIGAAVFVWSRNVGPQYIYFVQPFVVILVASGIFFGAKYLHTQIYGRYVYSIVIALALILVPNYGYFFVQNNTYHITSRAETPNYRKIFTYVKKNVQEGDVLITRNFRNYYWSGAQIKTFDFGSERSAELLAAEGKVPKITQEYLREIVSLYPRGWFVMAQNDEKFVTKEARAYAQENFQKMSHPNIRGPITVWHWDTLTQERSITE